MRFLSCIVALMLSAIVANAKPITREQAQKRASSFMLQRMDSKALTPVLNANKLSPKKKRVNTPWTEDPYYVFDRGVNEGFVIVSGDDQTIDVLGYCDEGSFDYQQMPPNMKEWLDDYADQIARIQAGAPVISDAIPTHAAVAPMMTCHWSQGNPYNLSCPYDGSNRSVTGCVATAMAQLLYHNRAMSVTETQATIPAFTSWTKKIQVAAIPAGSPIDWDNMKDSYGSATDLQKKAVADLMLYCGAAVKMDYTSGSSGAQSWDAYQAFLNIFGYSSSKVKWYDYTNVTSDTEWDRIVYTEMSEGRPIYISGSNASAGHAFVAHGYDGNKRYYINWGWGGQSDGYYYLTNLTPGDGQGIGGSDAGYNGYRQIFVGIEPENFGEKTMPISDATVKSICLANWDANGDGKFTYGEAAQVTDLGTAFSGKTIKKFSELYYFTSLTALADDAFSGCTALNTIRLPKSVKQIGARAFKGCTTLTQLDLPTGVKTVGEEAFSGCKVLANVELPNELIAVPNATFKGCAAITTMSLPVCVEQLGDEAFSGCTKLTEVTVNTYHPENIVMGTSVFANVPFAKATLKVLQGTKSYFAATDQWKEFGTIFEMRERSGGHFASIEAGNSYYLYNVGTGKYLTKGEAWTTQAIVGNDPILFKVNHTASMPDGVYYLSSTYTGSTTYLFRTSTDGNVGKGVQAAFVDRTTLTAADSYWKVQQVSDKVYTFQIPSNYANYAEGKYWGVQTDHQSSAASPTYGVYSDIVYADHQQNCHWQLVLYDANEENKYYEGITLLNLLSMAESRNVDAAAEQQVYNNLESTVEEIQAAQQSLRVKLKLIHFNNALVRDMCISLYDSDRNGELSYVEASDVTDLTDAFSFMNKTGLTNADELQYFTNASTLYGNTFKGCTNLESVVLPIGLQRIYYNAFTNCTKLTKITLPEYLLTIGSSCFSGCTALREVTVNNPDPSTISLGTNAFSNVPLAQCTLYVPAGAKERYAAANTWKDFGQIVEIRTRTQPAFATLEVDKPVYIYNIGTRRQVAMGEAYGTQSVVARTGRLYQLKRTTAMPEGCYYLYDNSTGKVVFRVSTDDKVGDGVKACFGDGSLSAKAYWKIASAGENLYTLQVPEDNADYVVNHYLGTNESHASGVASPTNGLYWDVAGVTARSTWAFIPQENVEAAKTADVTAEKLKYTLELAGKKGVDATTEQAVYDNLSSTEEQMQAAIRSLRDKMHLITFADDRALQIAVQWDTDEDGELSIEEAAVVTDLGEAFRSTAITELEELKYFTSLTAIPENAFRDAAKLKLIYLPESVQKIGRYAFSSCDNLTYVVVLNGTAVIPSTINGIGNKVTLFVKNTVLNDYLADADWSGKVAGITEYTGIPVVTAEGHRDYANTSATINYIVKGAPVNGTPEYVCDVVAEATQPVGSYPIVVKPGTITTSGLVCQEGVFTINQRKARITAQNCTREFGQPNPEFTVKYQGFRNGETAEEVILVQPVFTCEATVDSPVGTYDIVPSGAEALNYYFEYKSGTLTVTASSGVETVREAEKESLPLYDLQGRKVQTPKRGLYIQGSAKKKILIRK